MKPLRSIIVDDDPLAGTALQYLIKRSKQLELLQYFSSPHQALEFIATNKPDLLFLDVEMPDINGLNFIQLLRDLHDSIPVILISMHPDYASQAFDLNVTDFLTKPISYIRFQKAVSRVIEHYRQQKTPISSASFDHLYVKDSRNTQWVRLDLQKVIWIEARGDYATLHTLDKQYTIYTSMKNLMARLSTEQFIRVHRSYIVQFSYIEAIEDNTLCLTNKLIPLGGSYAKTLFERLNMIRS